MTNTKLLTAAAEALAELGIPDSPSWSIHRDRGGPRIILHGDHIKHVRDAGGTVGDWYGPEDKQQRDIVLTIRGIEICGIEQHPDRLALAQAFAEVMP